MVYFRALAALSLSAAVAAGEYYEGDGTSYTLGDVSSGNCNFMSAISIASTNYAAINNDQWDDLANCGRCAEVSCIDDACADQNTTAVVQILDRCPECSQGDLDLSPTVFETITGSSPSRLSIRWQFVDCPSPGTMEVCLKTGSNGYYVAVQPTNTVVGVESVTINGQSTTMVDSAYYFLIESTSDVDLTAVEVSVTSIDGDVIEGSYSLTAGECTDTGDQFGSSGSSTTASSTTSSGSSGTSTQQTTAPTATTTAPATSQTDAPATTTSTPATTTATPTTSAPNMQDSSTADEADDSYSSEDDQSSASTTTATPEATTAAPEATTSAPEATTATPETTTAAPEATTAAPEATTATPEATTAAPEASTDDTSKCHVRGRRRRD